MGNRADLTQNNGVGSGVKVDTWLKLYLTDVVLDDRMVVVRCLKVAVLPVTLVKRDNRRLHSLPNEVSFSCSRFFHPLFTSLVLIT